MSGRVNQTLHVTPVAAHGSRSGGLVDAVRNAIAETCKVDIDLITRAAELDSLGIDSLMMLDLESKFHQLSPSGFKTTFLKDCHSINDIINLVVGEATPLPDNPPTEGISYEVPKPTSIPVRHEQETQVQDGAAKYQGSKVTDPNRRKRIPMDHRMKQLLIDRLGLAEQPELLQAAPLEAGEKAAVFLIHAGSGFSRPYYRLSSLVDRNVWAIHDDKLLQQEEPWQSVPHIVQTYADLIRKASDGKPAIISGWSFGGIIAYEVAKLLQREGKVPVPGLLLVDPPPPNGYTNPRVEELLQRLFAKIFGVQSSRQNALGEALHRIAASNAIRCADLLETYVPTSSGTPPKTALLYAVDPVTTEFLAEEGDEHPPYDAWLCERENRDLALGGWFELLGNNVKIIDLPGNHYNILERDKVETTSAAYVEACEWIENGTQ